MIYTRLYGGMGNQMFQYALSRKLQYITGEKIVFDISKGTEFATVDVDQKKKTVFSEFNIDNSGMDFEGNIKTFNKQAGYKIRIADFLDYFPRAIRKITKSNGLYKLLVSFNQKVFNSAGIYSAFDYFCETPFVRRENYFVNGLFTCRNYFDDIHELLCNDFVPKRKPNDANATFLQRINSTNSVCVHIRKGSSYVDNEYLNVCSPEYFYKGMEYIKSKVDNPAFYFFTNDINWCQSNIMSDESIVYVNANDSQHAAEELHLMRHCKHFILSNSTMGWWAQYLNNNRGIVVSPSKWTKGKIELMNDLIEDSWIKIEV